MKGYIFFSVHEELFDAIALGLQARGVTGFGAFAWGSHQQEAVARNGVAYDEIVVFSRDLLPKCDDGRSPDLDWLARRERELGVSVNRMLAAERHLLKGRDYLHVMRLAEVALREIAASYDRVRPDFVFSEDVSCFHSYVHSVLARERGIPFWSIGSARMPRRISVYEAPERWSRFERELAALRARGLTAVERARADEYLRTFRQKPARPTGMSTRSKRPQLGLADLKLLASSARRYFSDLGDPTGIPPHRAIRDRIRRIGRIAATDAARVFEKPVEGERYVLYPIHFQPEASTLVQAPMYLDQVALLREIAASLPVGYRLYVKEHIASRGRRPHSFYNEVRAIPAVRLLGPDEDTWSLLRGARAVSVITGTMGLEALLLGKPVITFGNAFFNHHPSAHKASDTPKDRWHALFAKVLSEDHVLDDEASLIFVAALQNASYPGFVGGPRTYPEVMEPDNVSALTAALATELGLP